MGNRVFLKNRKKINKVKFLLLTIVALVIFSFFSVDLLGKKIMPIFLDYSESELKRIITIVIHKSVDSEIIADLNIESLFTIVKNNNNDIQTIDFNSNMVNNLLNKTTNKIEENLKKVENGDTKILEAFDIWINDFNYKKYKKGIVFQVPTSIIFSNALLTNIGPKIPVKIGLIGEVTSNVNTVVEEYGINNSVLNVYIEVSVSERMVLPLVSKNIVVSAKVPIAIKVIQGKVPNYYQNGLNKNSSMYILPVE